MNEKQLKKHKTNIIIVSVICVIFFIAAIIGIFNKEYFAGIITLLCGLAILPSLYKNIKEYNEMKLKIKNYKIKF